MAEGFQETFDYVIVGGGTAGVVLAARLSEGADIRVGLIEAGLWHSNDPLVNRPTGPGKMLHNPDYDWKFQSVPQASPHAPNCLGLTAFSCQVLHLTSIKEHR